MPRRGKKMSYAEKLACMERVKAKESDQRIAQQTGWSIWTVRKWRRAYQKQGESGLAPLMGRPKGGILSSYSAELRTELSRMRQVHPGWGPITLITELANLPDYLGKPVPSRARVAAFLKDKQWVRHYERHGGLPQPPPAVVQHAHEEWEMDAQGRQAVAGIGEVSVINILDVVSRLKVESYPQLWGSGLSWQDYQLVLRYAFLNYGMPQRITLDHDSAFFDNTSLSPYPSHLHLWLVGLGIEVSFIKKRPPLEHALIERTHQTMTAQGITGQNWPNQAGLWHGLAQRRQFLNTRYPSRALHYQAPLQAFPQAAHSGRAYRPEWETDLLDLPRLYTWLTQGKWFRTTNLHGEFWLGLQRYNAGRANANTTLEIIFDPLTQEFVAKRVATDQPRRFAAKGLSKADLMGEFAPFSRLPAFQLLLPFGRDVWRTNVLMQWRTGTTF